MLLMVIDDLHVISVRAAPNETDPPLVIDPDTMLAAPVTFQRFQAIAGWNEQVRKPPGGVQV